MLATHYNAQGINTDFWSDISSGILPYVQLVVGAALVLGLLYLLTYLHEQHSERKWTRECKERDQARAEAERAKLEAEKRRPQIEAELDAVLAEVTASLPGKDEDFERLLQKNVR